LSIAVHGVRRKLATSRRSWGSWARVVSVSATTTTHAAANSAAHSSSSRNSERCSASDEAACLRSSGLPGAKARASLSGWSASDWRCVGPIDASRRISYDGVRRFMPAMLSGHVLVASDRPKESN